MWLSKLIYCRYDWIEIHEGSCSKGEILEPGKVCGNEKPDSMLSQGNEVFVRFVSDVSITGEGFQITYIASKKTMLNIKKQLNLTVKNFQRLSYIVFK